MEQFKKGGAKHEPAERLPESLRKRGLVQLDASVLQVRQGERGEIIVLRHRRRRQRVQTRVQRRAFVVAERLQHLSVLSAKKGYVASLLLVDAISFSILRFFDFATPRAEKSRHDDGRFVFGKQTEKIVVRERTSISGENRANRRYRHLEPLDDASVFLAYLVIHQNDMRERNVALASGHGR